MDSRIRISVAVLLGCLVSGCAGSSDDAAPASEVAARKTSTFSFAEPVPPSLEVTPLNAGGAAISGKQGPLRTAKSAALAQPAQLPLPTTSLGATAEETLSQDGLAIEQLNVAANEASSGSQVSLVTVKIVADMLNGLLGGEAFASAKENVEFKGDEVCVEADEVVEAEENVATEEEDEGFDDEEEVCVPMAAVVPFLRQPALSLPAAKAMP